MDSISAVDLNTSAHESAISNVRYDAHRFNCVRKLQSSIASPLDQALAVVESAIQEKGLKAVLTTLFDVTDNLTYGGPSKDGPFPNLYPRDDLGHAFADIRNHLIVEVQGAAERLRKSVTAYSRSYGFNTLLTCFEDPYYAAREKIKWSDAFVAAGILALSPSSGQPVRAEDLRKAYKGARTDVLATYAEQAGVHGLVNAINEERRPFGEKGTVSILIRKGVLSVNHAVLTGG